jgi:hypothetical protein
MQDTWSEGVVGMGVWLARIRGGLPARPGAGMAGLAGRRGGPRRGTAGRRLRGLLALIGLAVVVAGCARAGQHPPDERVLGQGGEFAVGTFQPPAGGAGVLREGTLVVHASRCLALRHSSPPGGGTRVVAVPVGSFVSEQGTVYVADATGEADRTEGPVMAAHVGTRVRFTDSEVVLGGAGGGDIVMPPACGSPGTRVLVVSP